MAREMTHKRQFPSLYAVHTNKKKSVPKRTALDHQSLSGVWIKTGCERQKWGALLAKCEVSEEVFWLLDTIIRVLCVCVLGGNAF